MKNILFLLVLICCGVLTGFPTSGQDVHHTSTTNLNLVTVPVDKILEIYQGFAKVQLIIASNVYGSRHTITLHATADSPEAAQQMIEEALLKQAGIVTTHLDDKRISVTYNDHLKLEPQ